MTVPLSIVIPTFNESGNVGQLVNRLNAAVTDVNCEILFVDDSTDNTPAVIEAMIAESRLSLRLFHREEPHGGLSGAVLVGILAARHDWVLVMDGDLQHPPEMVPVLAAIASAGDADVVVASRYCKEGDPSGLSNSVRRAVSSLSTLLTRSMFPSKLRDCTDPMTGFFLLDRRSIDTATLQPSGFKILLEILARHPHRLRVLEEPFLFGERFDGESKASMKEGWRFLSQLFTLRFGRMSGFAMIGAIGFLINVALFAVFIKLGVEYLSAAAIAAEATILSNFALMEKFVFKDLSTDRSQMWRRLWKSLAFNNVEAALRLPLLYVLVGLWAVASAPATAITLALSFAARFMFHSRVVYAPQPLSSETPSVSAISLDVTLFPPKDNNVA
jgi:dolichol-phosphate mannosyltransferase